MQRNVITDIKDLRDETKNAFQSQAEVFLKHLEDLNSKILRIGQTLPKQEVNVLKFIENDLAEIKGALNLSKGFIKQNETIENEVLAIPKNTKKKLPLITDEEAEAFLLETVFNIKQDRITG